MVPLSMVCADNLVPVDANSHGNNTDNNNINNASESSFENDDYHQKQKMVQDFCLKQQQEQDDDDDVDDDDDEDDVDKYEEEEEEEEEEEVDNDTIGDLPNDSHHQKNKHVKFAPHNTIFYIGHLNDMKKSEIKRRWFSQTEFQRIANVMQYTVQKMEEIGDQEDVTSVDGRLCARGLECRAQPEKKKRMRMKQCVRRAIFDEQEYQRQENITDPEYIAALSIHCSKRSKEIAYRFGLVDETFVITHVMNDSSSQTNTANNAASTTIVVDQIPVMPKRFVHSPKMNQSQRKTIS